MKKKLIAIMLVVTMSLVSLFGTTAPVYAKSNVDVIEGVLKDKVIFDDLAKLTDAVRTQDAAKIFMCVLEIYPDFVASIKKQLEPEDYNIDSANNNADSTTPTAPEITDPIDGGAAGAIISDRNDNGTAIQPTPEKSPVASVSISALVITAVICLAVGSVATVAIVNMVGKPKKKRKAKDDAEVSKE